MQFVIYGLLVSMLVSCANAPQVASDRKSQSSVFKTLDYKKPIHLKLKANKDETTKTRYFSHSHISTFEGSQLVRERDEKVEFSILNTITEVNPSNGDISFISTAAEKDGTVDLNDLAFPEVGQKIDFVITSNAEVLKAGEYPLNSIFYLPPLPLPGKEVEVGDTWEFNREWVGFNGVPLKMNLVVILKAVVDCEGKPCAWLEMSGNVSLLVPEMIAAKFDSEVQGFMLFSLERGEVLWLAHQSIEKLYFAEAGTTVKSCMLGRLVEPASAALKSPERKKPCELPSLE